MNGDFLRYRGLVAVAVGAGVMIGAASVFLYQQLFGERRRLSQMMQQDIDQLGLSVEEIRKELHALRNLPPRSRRGRAGTVGAPSVVTDAETEMYSTIGADDVDDEFYDFSSDNENVTEEGKDSCYEQIDALLAGKTREDKTKAYGLLLELSEKDGESEEVLWRLAKACHLMSAQYGAEGNKEKKKEFITKGVEFGQKALELNSSNWNAHKWFAICIGARGELQSVKEKLMDGHTFKKHLDLAIAINPDDPTLHHLLGRFNYEVAALSWLERKVANTLFGDVPPGSNQDAIAALLEAERLNPVQWKENRLLLSKCYIAERDFKPALHWLDSAKEITAASAEEHIADKEIAALLAKYNSYRGLDT